MPDIELNVTPEEYAIEGSKFITFPPGSKTGAKRYLEVEVGELDWATPNKSLKIPVTVSEDGPDNGKEDQLSFGINKGGVWKGKEAYKNITGEEPEVGPNGRPMFIALKMVGKTAIGEWTMQIGYPGGDTNQPGFDMAKLTSILPAGSKPADAVPTGLGI